MASRRSPLLKCRPLLLSRTDCRVMGERQGCQVEPVDEGLLTPYATRWRNIVNENPTGSLEEGKAFQEKQSAEAGFDGGGGIKVQQ